MPELVFTKDIHAPAEKVFDLIADLSHYGKWLSSEGLFKELMSISDNPIRAGTTYADTGLTGKVTEFERPKHITFNQGMTIKMGVPLGGINLNIRYTLEAGDSETHLIRNLTLRLSGLLVLAQPILVRSISRENERILEKMKIYLEKH